MALRVIIECEPRHSLDSWVAWLWLEREVLKEVEDVSFSLLLWLILIWNGTRGL